ncbi:lysine-rich arabinogalactan protein 19-like [Eumetopias jubatus]|uniref:lysine-rich arabinogalactan protein 19-like n=1 Tax=Eumetopias jubatus TaxID=34886 RepID=UPI00101634C9|nr:lysine-rich arabinogalactan protein 19-like [Eumetopias jubatus]
MCLSLLDRLRLASAATSDRASGLRAYCSALPSTPGMTSAAAFPGPLSAALSAFSVPSAVRTAPARPRRLLRAPGSPAWRPSALCRASPRCASALHPRPGLPQPQKRDGPEPRRPRREQAPPLSLPRAAPQTRPASHRYAAWGPVSSPRQVSCAASARPQEPGSSAPSPEALLGEFSGPSGPSDPQRRHQRYLQGSS